MIHCRACGGFRLRRATGSWLTGWAEEMVKCTDCRRRTRTAQELDKMLSQQVLYGPWGKRDGHLRAIKETGNDAKA